MVTEGIEKANTMDNNKPNPAAAYRITIKETLLNSGAVWLDGIAITPQKNGETQLTGTFADQPALRGFMEQLWNLNFTVLSMQRIENEHPE